MSGHRVERIADQMHKELATIIQQQMRDPHVRGVTLTSVYVSRDLAWADIYFLCSALDTNRVTEDQAGKALERSSGFLRHRLSTCMRLRKIPQLRFHPNREYERAERVSHLLNSLSKANGDS